MKTIKADMRRGRTLRTLGCLTWIFEDERQSRQRARSSERSPLFFFDQPRLARGVAPGQAASGKSLTGLVSTGKCFALERSRSRSGWFKRSADAVVLSIASDGLLEVLPSKGETHPTDFGIERLEQHAESLAAAQRTTEKPSKGRNLLARVDDNAGVLVAAYRDIAETVREKKEITPAAEWLLDNFHVVDEQIRGIRTTSREATTACCPRSRRATLRDTRGSTGWPGPTLPIPTAGSSWRPCSDSSAPTSASSRSPSARGGRSPSTCAWPWWKTCGGWRS